MHSAFGEERFGGVPGAAEAFQQEDGFGKFLLHAGDGNLHPHILFDADDETQRQAAFEVSQEILRACLRLGGTISGEHGIGLEKISMMSEVYAPADLQTMGRLRRAFDPGGLLNPGKMLPEVRPA